MKQAASLCLAVLSFIVAAQAQAEPEFYRLTFNLKETEGGKPVNSRSYQMIVGSGDGTGSIRSGGRVPQKTNDSGAFTYIDVGVNIDVRKVRVAKEGLTMEIIAEASGTVEPADAKERPSNPPVIRQNRWDATVLLPLQKVVTVFSSDDATSKRQLQLEVTATPIR